MSRDGGVNRIHGVKVSPDATACNCRDWTGIVQSDGVNNSFANVATVQRAGKPSITECLHSA
jgi:hypothetical protein